MSSVAEGDLESISVAGVSREYLLHHRVCPDKLDGDGALIVAVGPGAFLEAISELSDVYSRRINTREASDDELERMIERITAHVESGTDPVRSGEEDTADVREIANQPPVIRYVNTLLHDAYEEVQAMFTSSRRVQAQPREYGSMACSLRLSSRREDCTKPLCRASSCLQTSTFPSAAARKTAGFASA